MCHVTTPLPLNSRQAPIRSGWASRRSSATGTQPACWWREGFCSAHSLDFEVAGSGGRAGGVRCLVGREGRQSQNLVCCNGRSLRTLAAAAPSRGFVLLMRAGGVATAEDNINIFTDYSLKPQCTCNPSTTNPLPLPLRSSLTTAAAKLLPLDHRRCVSVRLRPTAD